MDGQERLYFVDVSFKASLIIKHSQDMRIQTKDQIQGYSQVTSLNAMYHKDFIPSWLNPSQ